VAAPLLASVPAPVLAAGSLHGPRAAGPLSRPDPDWIGGLVASHSFEYGIAGMGLGCGWGGTRLVADDNPSGTRLIHRPAAWSPRIRDYPTDRRPSLVLALADAAGHGWIRLNDLARDLDLTHGNLRVAYRLDGEAWQSLPVTLSEAGASLRFHAPEEFVRRLAAHRILSVRLTAGGDSLLLNWELDGLQEAAAAPRWQWRPQRLDAGEP
jgi:hypothetical protein